MEILKDGTKEGYMVSLETDGFYFTITATTPSGNELVIKKAADEILFTASKPFAEALGLQVGYMGSDTSKPTPAPTAEPTATPTATPSATPSPTPEPITVKATISGVPTVDMTADQTAELSVSVDNDAEIDSVKWSCMGPAVIEAKDGNKADVTAVKAGKVTVYAEVTAKKDGKTAKDTAIAEFKVSVQGTIEMTANELMKGDSTSLSVSVDVGKIKNVSWSVNDDTLATIVPNTTDASKAVIIGNNIGTLTVSAEITSEYAGVELTGTATIDINIEEKSKTIYLTRDDEINNGYFGQETFRYYYPDGSLLYKSNGIFGGIGSVWKLNGDEGVDLSKYKVVLNYTASSNLPMFCNLSTNDEINETTKTGKELVGRYVDSGTGLRSLELTANEGTAYRLFIKRNGGDGNEADHLYMTIHSIKLIEK